MTPAASEGRALFFVIVAGLALGIYAVAVEPRLLRLERVDAPIAGLRPDLDGFSIGVLSDLHLGPFMPTGVARRAAARLAAEHPDLVVLAGDLVSTPKAVNRVDKALEPVTGSYAVLGNWDHSTGSADSLISHRAVQVLANRGVLVAPGLWLAGVDDVLHHRADLDRALAGSPAGAVRILVAHEPDFAERVQPRHRIALQISGHSHGGQVRLPFVGALLLPPLGRRYPAGLAAAPATMVYTSRGLGISHLPLRFLTPPEITLITLRRR